MKCKKTMWSARLRAGAMGSILAGTILLASSLSAAGNITIGVDTNDLPVGATTTIQLFLQPGAGAVAGVGATLCYAPSDLEVQYAGMDLGSVGGPTQAVHMVSHTPGKVVLGAARPQGTTHTPTVPEPIALLQVQRLAGSAAGGVTLR